MKKNQEKIDEHDLAAKQLRWLWDHGTLRNYSGES